jgi:hypothetical protein
VLFYWAGLDIQLEAGSIASFGVHVNGTGIILEIFTGSPSTVKFNTTPHVTPAAGAAAARPLPDSVRVAVAQMALPSVRSNITVRAYLINAGGGGSNVLLPVVRGAFEHTYPSRGTRFAVGLEWGHCTAAWPCE